MRYVARYYVRGRREPMERAFNSLDGALRFQVRGMADGSLFLGEIVDDRGRNVASHGWLLDHWSDILAVLVNRQPPSAYPPVQDLPA
jgi:hypothetical protein